MFYKAPYGEVIELYFSINHVLSISLYTESVYKDSIVKPLTIYGFYLLSNNDLFKIDCISAYIEDLKITHWGFSNVIEKIIKMRNQIEISNVFNPLWNYKKPDISTALYPIEECQYLLKN